MYTLDDILDDSSKFQNECSLVLHNLYIYCSRVRLQARFFKGLAGRPTLRGQRLLCITFMTSQSHLWRCCCIMTSRGPWLLRRCFKRGFGDHRKQPIYKFNWIVISIEIQLIKTTNRMAETITLFVCKLFQTTIFIQIKSREIKWWRHFPILSSSKFMRSNRSNIFSICCTEKQERWNIHCFISIGV